MSEGLRKETDELGPGTYAELLREVHAALALGQRRVERARIQPVQKAES